MGDGTPLMLRDVGFDEGSVECVARFERYHWL